MGTLVCLHAHPDDEVISTGGTMARAKADGHRVVLVVATNGEHGEVPDDLGADETINYETLDFAAEARRMTGKRGVDVVFEHTGEATWEKSIAALARGGRLVTCGATSGFDGRTDLRVLFAVVQSGSLAKAAVELRVSQPAVSQVISNLERSLGVRLVDRNSRGVEPTFMLARCSPAGGQHSTNCDRGSGTSSSSPTPQLAN